MTSPSTTLTATPAASSGTASTMGCSPNGYLTANNKTNTAGSDSSTAAAGNATSSAIGNFGSCTPLKYNSVLGLMVEKRLLSNQWTKVGSHSLEVTRSAEDCIPVASYSHGSADNIAVIAQFVG